MNGGAGNDTYVVDNVGDTVAEALNEGTDLVQSSVTYTLSANVENLALTGTTAINGTGNALDNVLTGNTVNNTLTGGAGNDTLNGGTGTDTMVGGTGDDTYVVDVTTDVVTEALNEGVDSVQSAATYTLGANVENLTLTGTAVINGTGNASNNTLTGNSVNNILDGAAGDDVLNGGAGTDSLRGGLGNDTFIVDSTTDTITENLNEGTDTVQSSVTFTLGANVENLVLTGTTAINGTGNTLNNVLFGNSANNTLSGGTGNDTLQGGAGNDIYVVDNTLDTVIENLNEGADLIQSAVTYSLSNKVENITLTGATAINATGNALNNALTGNTGVNVLTGGAGDDIYVVGTGDTVVENANEGTDTVQSTITWTLATNVENLTLTGTAVVNGTGNTLNNVITGNGANNILDGAAGDDTLIGGVGADTMKGGLGNDTFVVDATTDVVTENLNEGVDVIQTSVSLTTLAANVEGLVLTGTGLLTGVDNGLNNLLTGNTAANTLTTGTGNDILQGGDGNDTLKDTVGGNNLFNGGAGTDTITGTVGNELIVGGLGNDTIKTGAGADVMVFNRGDGQDIVNASTGADNTLSVGGGIQYADMIFRKNANDLILDVGATEQITLKDWYAATTNKSVVTLQMIEEAAADFNASGTDPLRNRKVETFDFAGLVTAFDQARVATPTLTSWALTNALTTYHLGGSDTAALGGDLAYQYGKNGNLSNVSFTPAQTILGNSQLGTAAQTLQPLAGLQDSSVRLS